MPLLDWIRGHRRGKGTSGPGEAAEALRATVGQLERLPMLPAGAAQAMAAARSADIPLELLARVIERDLALTAGVLRLANSALYGGGRSVQTLYEAVVKVGMRECYNLILTLAMRSLFRNVSPTQQLCLEQLWRHSLLTACVCRRLDARLKLGNRGEEFTCGLTHDLGRVLLAVAAPKRFAAADPMDFIEGPELLAREQAVLGTDHCEVGAWFAEQNGLPALVAEAAQFHHAPAEAPEHPALLALVAAGDHVASHYQREGDIEGHDQESNPHWPLLAGHSGVAESLLHEMAPLALAEAVEEEAEIAVATPSGGTAAPAPAGPEPASRTGDERRVNTRYWQTMPALCHPLGKPVDSAWKVTVENISRTGLALRLPAEVSRGTVLVVALQGVGGRFARPLLVRAMNARPRPPDHWHVGCAFVKPLADDEIQVLLSLPGSR